MKKLSEIKKHFKLLSVLFASLSIQIRFDISMQMHFTNLIFSSHAGVKGNVQGNLFKIITQTDTHYFIQAPTHQEKMDWLDAIRSQCWFMLKTCFSRWRRFKLNIQRMCSSVRATGSITFLYICAYNTIFGWIVFFVSIRMDMNVLKVVAVYLVNSLS